MWALKTLLVVAILYASVVAIAWAMQTRMLFPASMVPRVALPPGAQRLLIETGGHQLHGMYVPPERGSGKGPVLLGFGGNAWSAASMAGYLHDLYPQAEVVAFHYRGYAPSTGAPGAEALIADAPLIHDLAAARFPGRPIVAIGFSVGSGVAASLAARRPLAGLILVTPFDSLERVAAGQFPWLPVRWLFRHEMPVAAWLRDSTLPVAIVAAERDTLVPRERTDALRRALPRIAFDKTIAGADHNSVYEAPDFRAAMREALLRINSGRQDVSYLFRRNKPYTQRSRVE